jgi:hypothetical protein
VRNASAPSVASRISTNRSATSSHRNSARTIGVIVHDQAACRLDGRRSLELARLRDSFNRMAVRLAAADADNRVSTSSS